MRNVIKILMALVTVPLDVLSGVLVLFSGLAIMVVLIATIILLLPLMIALFLTEKK